MNEHLYARLPPDTCAALRRLGVLGDAGDVPPLPSETAPLKVTADEATFLEHAVDVVTDLRARAEAIGPPGIFDWGASYGEKWSPMIDALVALQDQAREALGSGTEAMGQFNRGAIKLNNAFFKIRSTSPSEQLYNAVIEAFRGNPILLMRFVVRQAASVERLAVDTKKAAVEVWGGWLGDLWAWLPWWGKVAVPLVVVAVPVVAVYRVKKAVTG